MMVWVEQIAVIIAVAAGISGGVLILVDSSRIMLVTLAAQYFLFALLVCLSLPIQVAVVKLVAGLLACAIMSLSISRTGFQARLTRLKAIPSGKVFRMIAVMLVIFSAGGIGHQSWMTMLNISSGGILGAIFLMSFGILQLGLFSEEPMRIGIGLLTVLSGFEVAYSAIEPSLVVLALLASVHIGIALTIGYVLTLMDNPNVARKVPE